MKKFIKSLFILIFLSVMAWTPNRSFADTEAVQFGEKVYQLLRDKEFLRLEELAESLRQEKAFFKGGGPKLAVFYNGLSTTDSSDRNHDPGIQEVKAYIRLLDEWNDTVVNSSTARIALADAYVDLAWLYRGSGLSGSITNQGRENFNESLVKAWEYLDSSEDINNNDPHLYLVRIRTGLGLGISKVYMYEYVRHSMLIFPGYIDTYKSMQVALLPRWYGDKGEVERFADWLSAMTEDDYGDQMYSLITSGVLGYVGIDAFDGFQFDLDRASEGIKQIIARFPEQGKDNPHFTYLLIQSGEFELAKKMFASLKFKGDKTAERFWGTVENFNYWRTIAYKQKESNKSPVIEAAKRNDLRALINALGNGGSMNDVDYQGNSALMLSLKKVAVDNNELIRHLIENNADVNLEDNDGYDALYYAIAPGNADMIKLLSGKGSDLRKQYQSGWTVLHYAANRGYMDIVETLTDLDDQLIFIKTDNDNTALHLAAKEDYGDIVEHLLNLDPTLIDQQNNFYSSALHLAAKEGSLEATEILLEHGANVSLKTARGATALNYAMDSKDLKLINLLKGKGASENVVIDDEQNKFSYDHYLRGNDLYNKKKWKASKQALQKSIEINPYFAPTWATYSMLESFGFKNPKKGLAYADKAIELDPDYVYSFYVKGRALDALNRKEEAFDEYAIYISLEPESAMSKDLLRRYPNLGN